MYDVKSTVYSPCEANVPRCERAPGGALFLAALMVWRAWVIRPWAKERNSAFDMSIQEAREAAMLLVEQDRAVIKGDLVSMK